MHKTYAEESGISWNTQALHAHIWFIVCAIARSFTKPDNDDSDKDEVE